MPYTYHMKHGSDILNTVHWLVPILLQPLMSYPCVTRMARSTSSLIYMLCLAYELLSLWHTTSHKFFIFWGACNTYCCIRIAEEDYVLLILIHSTLYKRTIPVFIHTESVSSIVQYFLLDGYSWSNGILVASITNLLHILCLQCGVWVICLIVCDGFQTLPAPFTRDVNPSPPNTRIPSVAGPVAIPWQPPLWI